MILDLNMHVVRGTWTVEQVPISRCYEMAPFLIPLDRDTARSPRTRVLAGIARRSAHCSLMRTHKPGSPLLLCPARTPVPLAQVLTHCRLLYKPSPSISPSLRTPTLVIIPRSQLPRPRNVISDNTLFHVSSSSSRHAPS